MKGGLFIALVLLALGCLLSAGNQLAAKGGKVGALERMGFGPGRQIAQAKRILNEGSGDGEPLAAEALASDPMNKTALDLIGSSALVNKDFARADSVFRVAAQLGWRDVTTQRYWLFASLALNDEVLAAQRLDALLRIKTPEAPEEMGMEQLESTAAGRAAWLNQMMQQPPWLAGYLVQSAAIKDNVLANRLAMIDLAHSHNVEFPNDAVALLSRALLKRGQPQAARQLWISLDSKNGAVSNGQAPSILQGGFEGEVTSEARSPFLWRLLPGGDLNIQVQPAPAPLVGHALRILYSGSVSKSVAEQILILPAGAYVLRWRVAASDPGDADAVAPGLTCGRHGEAISATPLAEKTPNIAAFSLEIPRANCSFQVLSILVRPSEQKQRGNVWLDDVAITPL